MARPLAICLSLILLVLGACSRSETPTGSSGGRGSQVPRAWLRPDSRSFAEFRPSHHGFRFTNRFTGSPLPVSLGALEKYVSVPNSYGLCGGMSFAAADYYLANLEPPADLEPPSKGDPLYAYLYSRQLESLGASLAAVPRFANWMSLPDATPMGTGSLTVLGLEAVRLRLEVGQPAHLGLVLTSARKGGALWENHQVLAYGTEDIPGRGLVIRIYDPNFASNDTAALRVRWASAGPIVLGVTGTHLHTFPWPAAHVTRTAQGRRDTPVRGFFLMDYTPRTPPAF